MSLHTNAISPSELPNSSVTKRQLWRKANWVQYEGDEKWKQRRYHHENGNAVELVFQVGVEGFEADAG